MKKFTDWLWKNQWVAGAVMYVAICIWIYLTAQVEIEGVRLPQHDAGMLGLAVWHGMLLLAFAGAWLLHKIVEIFTKIRKNKK